MITALDGTACGTLVAMAVIAAAALVNWRAAPFAAIAELGASATYSLVNVWLQRPRPRNLNHQSRPSQGSAVQWMSLHARQPEGLACGSTPLQPA